MEFTHYQRKAVDCIACHHGVPKRSMSYIPTRSGYVVLPTSAVPRIRVLDHVVRFNPARLAARLAKALHV